MSNGINVLNLCDGILCGKVALDRAGIKVNKYFQARLTRMPLLFLRRTTMVLFVLVILLSGVNGICRISTWFCQARLVKDFPVLV